MGETPIPWAILELVQTRLRTVRRANDYRTDAGRDVRLEPAPFDPGDAPRLTLFPLTSVFPDDARSAGERGFTLDGAKLQLKSNLKTAQRHMLIIQKLQHLRQFLVEMKEQL